MLNHYIKCDCLDLKQTLRSGQCFRWREKDGCFFGVAGNKSLLARQETDGITLIDVNESDLPFWENYFDIGTDYAAIIKQFSADETLRKASEQNRGVRILRQEPFETLISFIISQNNNIPRITGIINRLCEGFGERLENGEYGFPDVKTLASLSEEDLAPLRAGFRNKYILDAAKKTYSGEVDLSAIYGMTYDEGKEYLKRIKGVGDKVADCVLLFAYHKTEAFPSDVWIKRIVAEYYGAGLPECMGEYRGIAQQYLFEYFRKA